MATAYAGKRRNAQQRGGMIATCVQRVQRAAFKEKEGNELKPCSRKRWHSSFSKKKTRHIFLRTVLGETQQSKAHLGSVPTCRTRRQWRRYCQRSCFASRQPARMVQATAAFSHADILIRGAFACLAGPRSLRYPTDRHAYPVNQTKPPSVA
jgi:hypothetical protein